MTELNSPAIIQNGLTKIAKYLLFILLCICSSGLYSEDIIQPVENVKKVETVDTILERIHTLNKKKFYVKNVEMTDTECLSMEMYHEARSDGIIGMKAVAYVIHNRKERPNMFADSYCDVIKQHKQF